MPFSQICCELKTAFKHSLFRNESASLKDEEIGLKMKMLQYVVFFKIHPMHETSYSLMLVIYRILEMFDDCDRCGLLYNC